MPTMVPAGFSRRSLFAWMSVGIAALAAHSASAQPETPAAGASREALKAIAFDAFAVFDPRPIAAACEREFPGRGAELVGLWRGRQFEYQWLRALGAHYADFEATTAAALDFACASLKLPLTLPARDALLGEFLRLRAWPEAAAALRAFRQRGLKLALLSNATTRILDAAIANSNLAGVFDYVISTDRNRSYKPDPRAYRLGSEVLRLDKSRIVFVASAGWDAAGARWYGYPTFWNNRMGAAAEALDAPADASGATLVELSTWVGEKMGWTMGLEPTTAEITTRGSTS